MQSHSFDYDLLCIGSGPAGQRAAVQAAKFAKRVAVIERRGTLGGACVDTGTIPSKTLREAVLWIRAGQARSPAMSPGRPTAAELLERVAAEHVDVIAARPRSGMPIPSSFAPPTGHGN